MRGHNRLYGMKKHEGCLINWQGVTESVRKIFIFDWSAKAVVGIITPNFKPSV